MERANETNRLCSGIALVIAALVAGERRPRGPIVHSLRIVPEPSPCGQCGRTVEPGLVGWYACASEGPLCRGCLGENAPSLALLADAAIYGLPRALRESGSPEVKS